MQQAQPQGTEPGITWFLDRPEVVLASFGLRRPQGKPALRFTNTEIGLAGAAYIAGALRFELLSEGSRGDPSSGGRGAEGPVEAGDQRVHPGLVDRHDGIEVLPGGVVVPEVVESIGWDCIFIGLDWSIATLTRTTCFGWC